MSQELKQGQTNNFYWPDSVCKVISDSVLLSPECQLWAWLPSLSFSSFLYHLCFLLCYTGQLTTDSSCCMVIWYHMGQVFILGSPVASLELFLERIIFISRRGIGFFPPHPKGIDMVFPLPLGLWVIWPKIRLPGNLGSIQNYELLSKLLKLEHSNRGNVSSWIQSDPCVSFSVVEYKRWSNLPFTLAEILWCASDGWTLSNFTVMAVPWMF